MTDSIVQALQRTPQSPPRASRGATAAAAMAAVVVGGTGSQQRAACCGSDTRASAVRFVDEAKNDVGPTDRG